MKTISGCGRKVLSEHHMSRGHAGGWGSPLITCGVMKPLKNNVHANSLGWADPLSIPADMSICVVTLVSSLVVSSSLPVPALERQWYQGILHPISTLVPLPFIFSLIKICEPDLQLAWVRGWFMLSERSEGLHSQFIVCKINWAELNDILCDVFGELCIGCRDI